MYDVDANETTYENNKARPNWWTWPEMEDRPEHKQPRVYFRNPTGGEIQRFERTRTRWLKRLKSWQKEAKKHAEWAQRKKEAQEAGEPFDEEEPDVDNFEFKEEELEEYFWLALRCVERLERIGRDGVAFDWNDGEQLMELRGLSSPDACRRAILLSLGPVERRMDNFISLCHSIAAGLRDPQKKSWNRSSGDSSETPTPQGQNGEAAAAEYVEEQQTSDGPDG